MNTLPDREILSFLVPAIQWFAASMKCMVVTDSAIGLVADQREYPLPSPDFLYMTWVQIAGNLLDPTTTWSLNAGGASSGGGGQTGQTWMSASAGTPTCYTIEGRSLILYPPASATFVASTPTMQWRYVGLGAHFTAQGTSGLGPQGIPALTDVDLNVVRYEAARAWLAAHLIGQKPEDLASSQAQIGAFQATINRDLPECKERWMDAIRNTGKRWRVDVGGRLGAAR